MMASKASATAANVHDIMYRYYENNSQTASDYLAELPVKFMAACVSSSVEKNKHTIRETRINNSVFI